MLLLIIQLFEFLKGDTLLELLAFSIIFTTGSRLGVWFMNVLWDVSGLYLVLS